MGYRTVKGAAVKALVRCGWLLFVLAPGAVAQPQVLTAQEVREDVDQFQLELEQRAAYLKPGNPDYRSALEAIRAKGAAGLTVYQLGIEIDKVLALLIDSHSAAGYAVPVGYLPFWMDDSRGRAVAFWPDRSGFVDSDFPFVSRIDGRTIGEWVEALKVVVPRGSPQYVRRYGLWLLILIQYARDVVGDDRSAGVLVELESGDGAAHKALSLSVATRYPAVSVWPATSSEILPGNIGYLRLIGMWDEAARAEIVQWMPRFRSTAGLIIDIRDIGGGDRDVLRTLYPYLVRARDRPRVANVAKYRLSPTFGPDHLASRRIFRWDWSGWTFADRLAIAELMATFAPEWEPPAGEFSDWHFWVLSKRLDPAAYDYSGPVVFLTNEQNGSASDVILSAVKGLRRVTIVGRPSLGASGAYVETTLPHSGIRLRLSSMASFQRDGRFYEGHGVEPDVYVDVEPEFLVGIGPDTELQAAIDVIRRTVGRAW